MATAARENRPVIINDYLDSSLTEPWHDRAREFGWRSSAAFPVPRGGKPFAVFSVYHAHRNVFDEEATALLREMSADISFALDNFDREEQRTRYEKAVRESESLLSTILENVGACIYLKDLEGKYLFVNRQVLATWGTSACLNRIAWPVFARTTARCSPRVFPRSAKRWRPSAAAARPQYSGR